MIWFGLLLCLSVALTSAKDCLMTGQCSCTFDDSGAVIDLSSLGNKDNTPRFKDVFYGPDDTYYSYNPCGGFSEGICANAAACAINSDKSEQLQIGDAFASKTSFSYDDSSGNVLVTYLSGTGIIVLTEVELLCDPFAYEPVFGPKGQISTDQFQMQLTTACACPDMCAKAGLNSSLVAGGPY